MGMSTHVVGIVPPDDTFLKMRAVYETCKTAKVRIPEDVVEFFNHEPPDEQGVVASLPKECIRVHNADMENGFEIDLTKVPKHVKAIRFYNSY